MKKAINGCISSSSVVRMNHMLHLPMPFPIENIVRSIGGCVGKSVSGPSDVRGC